MRRLDKVNLVKRIEIDYKNNFEINFEKDRFSLYNISNLSLEMADPARMRAEINRTFTKEKQKQN